MAYIIRFVVRAKVKFSLKQFTEGIGYGVAPRLAGHDMISRRAGLGAVPVAWEEAASLSGPF